MLYKGVKRSRSWFLIGWWGLAPFYSNCCYGFQREKFCLRNYPWTEHLCVCFQMGGKCWGKMGAVSQLNETNLVCAHTHTQTHRVPLGPWKCHIIGFPFQDNRHAHWIRSDHRRQFPLCLSLSFSFFLHPDCLFFASLFIY